MNEIEQLLQQGVRLEFPFRYWNGVSWEHERGCTLQYSNDLYYVNDIHARECEFETFDAAYAAFQQATGLNA